MKHQNISDLPTKLLVFFVILFSIIVLYVLCDWNTFNLFDSNTKNEKDCIQYCMKEQKWSVSEKESNEHEIFDVEPITITEEEKQYKWASKEIYWVRLNVNEEQIEKYVENFKFVVWIIETCWIHDAISNKWNKYSDEKLKQLQWLKWETVENQVHLLKATWIDIYSQQIIKKCYVQAKKEKATKNLNFIESLENDNFIKTLEDFQHLRIELWLTTLSI